MPRLAGPLLALALMGCTVDFTDPQPNTPTQFGIRIQHGPESVDFSFQATLFPGTDGNGRRIAVLDDTILVSHRRFSPTADAGNGGLVYTGGWPGGPATAPDLIEVVPPQVDARTAPTPPRIRVAQRAGPADLVVAPGDSLILSIDLGANPDEAPQSQGWTVEIRSASPSYFARFGDTTSVPARLAFPPEMIPVEWSELEVEIRIAETWEAWAGDGGYMVRLTAQPRLHWTVRRADVPGGASEAEELGDPE